MNVLHINQHNFREEVIQSEKPVLLDFWAPWCGPCRMPCRMLSPILDEIAEETDEFKICKINVDEEHDLASAYKVFSIPTLMMVHQGKVEDKMVGARPKNQILAMLG